MKIALKKELRKTILIKLYKETDGNEEMQLDVDSFITNIQNCFSGQVSSFEVKIQLHFLWYRELLDYGSKFIHMLDKGIVKCEEEYENLIDG